MPLPVAVGLNTRVMVEAFDENDFIPQPKLGQAFFGNLQWGGRTVYSPDSSFVEIDLMVAEQKLAKMIPRGAAFPILNLPANLAGKFDNKISAFPLIHEQDIITNDQLEKREPGENPYQGDSQVIRYRKKAFRLYRNMQNKCNRTMEYLSWQSLFTGQMPAIIGTTNNDLIYDFGRHADNTIEVAIAWDQEASKPLDDLDDAVTAIRRKGHMGAKGVVMGTDAMRAFKEHADVRALADNRRFVSVEINSGLAVPANLQFMLANGATLAGKIVTPKSIELWVFAYDEGYVDDNEDFVPYVPVDQALVFATARFDRYFGPSPLFSPEILASFNKRFGYDSGVGMAITDTSKNIIDINAYTFHGYMNEGGTNVTFQTFVSPIFATTHANALAALTGLTTPSSS